MTQTRHAGDNLRRLAGTRIFILEDEAMISFDLSTAFEAEGATVLAARTVPKALSLLETETPDAAVLDVNLGGGRTCEAVAARLGEMGIPFLLHSGDLHRHGELVETIGAKIVAKPASSATVAREVAALLES